MPAETHVQTCPVELSKPVKVSEVHELGGIGCGERSIDEYLKKRARNRQQETLAVEYVTCFNRIRQVASIFTFSSGSFARQSMSPKKLQRNTATAHPNTTTGPMGRASPAYFNGT
ncbi:MAG: hypothetical protein P0Y58_21145 [Candidatus Pseudomonas phytovorans]|uniref:Uncharacterized protein n=1 Tax=Candidatus Pseudomonas phytovorans TaxID=3121377 RepID=A0AAJ5WGQ3_9PSED|nr:hypothetical protein [Pseudomonas sp.]WEK29387.1 MAG: hypothetical protein P0Y58_21145 [Pseudomonas sp.]